MRDARDDAGSALTRDLLITCHGFCAALDGHHAAEDRVLFPALVAEHPELATIVRDLQRDHAMLAHLLGQLRLALDRGAGPSELEGHLDGIEAIMLTHFRYEERVLMSALQTLRLDRDPQDALGPLAPERRSPGRSRPGEDPGPQAT